MITLVRQGYNPNDNVIKAIKVQIKVKHVVLMMEPLQF